MINKYFKDYVLFDLETTGLAFESDEVIEISAVKVRDGKIVDEFSTLVNPEMHIPDAASEVNGIYDDMVKNAPPFRIALNESLEFAGNDVLVGHNINNFDMKFIIRDAQKFYRMEIENDYADTLHISRAYLPELPHHTLAALSEHYGISTAGAHRALNDCKMNQQVFECLAREILNPSKAAMKVRKCPYCGCVLKLRNGKFGEFYGCTGYPNCRYTENTDVEE